MGRKRTSKTQLFCLGMVALYVIITTKYFKTGVARVDTSSIIFYRILGNDLPPRHSSNQTLTNLLFILQNEPSFINVTKIWILNRIVNEQVERVLIALLNQYNRLYIRIPFDWDEYRQIPYYFPLHYPSDEYFDSLQFYRLSSIDKIRLIDILYSEKNLYVMNNNGARNFALRHGKHQTRAQWLMIFDGNCYLSQDGFDEIRHALLINGSHKQYFLVSMGRLTDNNNIFHTRTINMTAEPQIIFRRDSTVEFLETMRYGLGPKEELLVHLGAMKGFWRRFEWEPDGRKALVTFGDKTNQLFERAGFVFRLYSGYHPDYELLNYLRACSRSYGIHSFLDNLDFQIRREKLLPTMANITLHKCMPWSVEELKKIVRTARQVERMNENKRRL